MKKYTYSAQHINILKRYNTFRLILMLVFSLILCLQGILWLMVWSKDIAIPVSDMVFVGITLLGCLSLIIAHGLTYKTTTNIIENVKENGSFTVKKYTVPYANKNSWAWGYVLLSRIIAVVCVILLGIMLVTFFQNYLNWGRIILKMPLMLYISMAFINLSGVLRFEGKINAQDLD